jgi:hypothetical protein
MTMVKCHCGFAHQQKRLVQFHMLHLAKTRAHHLHHLAGGMVKDMLAGTL